MTENKERMVNLDSSGLLTSVKISSTPGEIRTPDLLIRSQTLYPAELRAHRLMCFLLYQKEVINCKRLLRFARNGDIIVWDCFRPSGLAMTEL